MLDYYEGGDYVFFSKFHNKSIFEESLNAVFISLIPKVAGADNIKNFRPINLLGNVYEILAKVLASRLRKVMEVVPPNQHAFIPRCQIWMLVCLIMNALFLISNLGVRIFFISLILGRLMVSWGFFFAILEKMGFPKKWRNWITFCISTILFSILIDREASGFISSSRGLRQGDPLLHLLFILVMETLSKLVNKAIDGGLLDGFHIGSPALRVC